jgi:hypothetical protein
LQVEDAADVLGPRLGDLAIPGQHGVLHAVGDDVSVGPGEGLSDAIATVRDHTAMPETVQGAGERGRGLPVRVYVAPQRRRRSWLWSDAKVPKRFDQVFVITGADR